MSFANLLLRPFGRFLPSPLARKALGIERWSVTIDGLDERGNSRLVPAIKHWLRASQGEDPAGLDDLARVIGEFVRVGYPLNPSPARSAVADPSLLEVASGHGGWRARALALTLFRLGADPTLKMHPTWAGVFLERLGAPASVLYNAINSGDGEMVRLLLDHGTPAAPFDTPEGRMVLDELTHEPRQIEEAILQHETGKMVQRLDGALAPATSRDRTRRL